MGWRVGTGGPDEGQGSGAEWAIAENQMGQGSGSQDGEITVAGGGGAGGRWYGRRARW